MLSLKAISKTIHNPLCEMRGRVQMGNQLGRTIGFPTTNIPMDEFSTLSHGIYVSLISINGGRRLPSVSYIGRRPTVEGTNLLLETHIFDFDRTIYGALVTVELFEQLRGDAFFRDLEGLTEQIAKDCAMARRKLAAMRAPQAEKSTWTPYVGFDTAGLHSV